MGKYDDIINLPYIPSADRPHMSNYARAAQFAPFAALTGYEDEIAETERITDAKIQTDEYIQDEINRRLNFIKENIESTCCITVTYFIPDMIKQGGKYQTEIVKIKKIDTFKGCVVTKENKNIPIENIYRLESDCFDKF